MAGSGTPLRKTPTEWLKITGRKRLLTPARQMFQWTNRKFRYYAWRTTLCTVPLTNNSEVIWCVFRSESTSFEFHIHWCLLVMCIHQGIQGLYLGLQNGGFMGYHSGYLPLSKWAVKHSITSRTLLAGSYDIYIYRLNMKHFSEVVCPLHGEDLTW